MCTQSITKYFSCSKKIGFACSNSSMQLVITESPPSAMISYYILIPQRFELYYRIVLQLQTEIKIHRTLKHSYIVKFERFFEDNTNVYMVLELCNNNVSFHFLFLHLFMQIMKYIHEYSSIRVYHILFLEQTLYHYT